MPVCRQANHRAVAKHVVLTVDEPQFVAEIEIAPVEAAPRGHLRVPTGLPFATLDEHRRIRDQRVATNMIEMKMRVDDEIDLAGVSVDCFESRTHFFA